MMINDISRVSGDIKQFFKLESASGIILMITAVLAMICANSPLASTYTLLIETPVAVQIGTFAIHKPLLLWVNDGLMAVFFFLVGLELKREWVEGELKKPENRILPALGALGGMVGPALIYFYFNMNDPVALKGWAIPAATDIAFALGVLALLGDRVPLSLKVFLTSLAIFDDIGAVVIIAAFYTKHISMTALVIVAVCIGILAIMNKRGVLEKSPYIFIGAIMWVATLKSGVHATLAGVIMALFIPLKTKDPNSPSLLREFEHDLHSVVAFVILPIFAFCNAGLSFEGLSVESLAHPVPLGIAAGLVVGKQLGVFIPCFIAVKLGWAQLPDHSRFRHLFGVAMLTGIGFTMSLFIGSLAFEETGVNLLFDERLGIVLGSAISGVLGYLWLWKAGPVEKA